MVPIDVALGSKRSPRIQRGCFFVDLLQFCRKIAVAMFFQVIMILLILYIFTVRRQRRVVRRTFSAELNGLADSVEQVLLLQCSLHRIYCGTIQTPERMIDMLEGSV